MKLFIEIGKVSLAIICLMVAAMSLFLTLLLAFAIIILVAPFISVYIGWKIYRKNKSTKITK